MSCSEEYGPDGTDLGAVAADLVENPYAENVEENVWVTLSGGSPPLPSDPLIDPSSGDPDLYQWGSHTLNLPAAWQLAKGHAWVGVIDTGIEVEHPDLRTYSGVPDVDLAYQGGNFREHLSWDYRYGDCNVDELDPNDFGFDPGNDAGHGTHVAGIVAGTADNGVGIAGACWHCSLLITGQGYELDGIEGYIYPTCEPEPECIPEGAERLYRLYNETLDDYVIFPQSELETWQAADYGSQSGLADWIGYAYLNVDVDGDGLIDGFELLLGTDPANADTDCDGVSDGMEVHTYDRSDPDPALHGYGDPLHGSCLFFDGFETGDASRWTSSQG